MRRETAVAIAMLTLLAYTTGLSFVGQAFSEGQTRTTISNVGTVQGIGVGIYWDYECTNPLSTIDWGTLMPGSSKNVVCYIRNEGDSPLTLSLVTSDWTPSAAEVYMTVSWDYNEQTLSPDEKLLVELTLTVYESIESITSFSFDITIVGSG